MQVVDRLITLQNEELLNDEEFDAVALILEEKNHTKPIQTLQRQQEIGRATQSTPQKQTRSSC